jgi:branched-chain amino acid transport system permease protein
LDAATFFQSVLNGLTLSGIYILVALGLTLVLSIMGIVQFAHGEIYMIGSYCVYYMVVSYGVNFFLALIIATIFVGGLGIFIERYCFRPFRGQLERALIVSIGLMIILQNLVLSIAGGTPKSIPPPLMGVLRVGGVSISWERLLVVLVGLGLLVVLFLFIRFSKIGQAMLAASQNRVAAALQGINLDRVSAIAMFLGCGLAAIAGALVGTLFSLTPTMGSFALMQGIAVIILGGLGSIPGAIIGGLVIGLIDGIMPVFTTANIAGLIDFGVVVMILLFRPQGIWGHE